MSGRGALAVLAAALAMGHRWGSARPVDPMELDAGPDGMLRFDRLPLRRIAAEQHPNATIHPHARKRILTHPEAARLRRRYKDLRNGRKLRS